MIVFKNKIFLSVLIVIVVLTLTSLLFPKHKTKDEEEKINVVELEERSMFFEAIQKSPKTDNQKKIIAGISPHHLLAADLIAESISIALGGSPETIILVGPNHEGLGESEMISSDFSWQTDLGTAKPNIELLHRLRDGGFLKLYNDIIKKDHAIFNLLPFIKYYSPGSDIVPILMNYNISLDYIQKFSDYLDTNVGVDYVIISSIDFSHYLSAETAAKKDEETLELIKEFHLEKIFSLTNDHIDCPACLALPMIINEKKGGGGMKLIKNTNSGFLMNNYNSETTSYIIGFFVGK